jgi:hypothetical protein
MTTTVAQESIFAEQNLKEGAWAVFKGRNLIRSTIASWPKVVQQFVGLSVVNTYATYFCKSPTWCPFAGTLVLTNLTTSSPICWKQGPFPSHRDSFMRPVDLSAPYRYFHRSIWSPALDSLPLRCDQFVGLVSWNHRMLRLH